MALNAWLPVGYKLPDGATFRRTLFDGAGWQIVETQGGGRTLLAQQELSDRWVSSGLIEQSAFSSFRFGPRAIASVSTGPSHMLCPVYDSPSPSTKNEALAFAQALASTRAIDQMSPLQDAIYIERFTRLLPSYGITSRTPDDVVFGFWLTGGARVSVTASRRLAQMLSWMTAAQLEEVLRTGGFDSAAVRADAPGTSQRDSSDPASPGAKHQESGATKAQAFVLPGRPELEAFFNDHVIDIVTHRDRYKALGISFPSAVVLHGPPGSGKTFAVERLVDFLGWPSFEVEASTIASPYIHETGRKIAAIFDQAIKSAPSVLVIDEMDAFLSDRDLGSGQHRVEEVAEFLRRIPAATQNEVLIVAMTNRLDMIDPAVLRRGRFDHVIRVDYATEQEVQALLDQLLSAIPTDITDTRPLAASLAGRPLADVAFVVREAARLAARAGKDQLDHRSLAGAMNAAPARNQENDRRRRIGFI
jgi:cell division protease FtsH